MLLLLGSGAPGLALLPAISVWFALASVRLRSRDRAQGTGLLVAIGALALGMGLYFFGWHSVGGRHPGPREIFLTAIHAASSPGGDQMSNFWPLSGIALTIGLLATAVLVILHLRTRESRDQWHGLAIALGCFGVAMWMLVGAIGWGRGARDWFKGLESHYSDLMLPLACWAYIVWDQFLRVWRRAVGILFLVAAILSYGLNATRTLRAYRTARTEEAAFVQAMCNGASPKQLLGDYTALVFFDNEGSKSVPLGIKYLKAEKMGLFDCSEYH